MSNGVKGVDVLEGLELLLLAMQNLIHSFPLEVRELVENELFEKGLHFLLHVRIVLDHLVAGFLLLGEQTGEVFGDFRAVEFEVLLGVVLDVVHEGNDEENQSVHFHVGVFPRLEQLHDEELIAIEDLRVLHDQTIDHVFENLTATGNGVELGLQLVHVLEVFVIGIFGLD